MLYNFVNVCFNFLGDNLHSFHILVGDTIQHETSRMHICAYIKEPLEDGENKHVICDKPVSGRIVKIQLDSVTSLSLCEVEVYGERGKIFVAEMCTCTCSTS